MLESDHYDSDSDWDTSQKKILTKRLGDYDVVHKDTPPGSPLRTSTAPASKSTSPLARRRNKTPSPTASPSHFGSKGKDSASVATCGSISVVNETTNVVVDGQQKQREEAVHASVSELSKSVQNNVDDKDSGVGETHVGNDANEVSNKVLQQLQARCDAQQLTIQELETSKMKTLQALSSVNGICNSLRNRHIELDGQVQELNEMLAVQEDVLQGKDARIVQLEQVVRMLRRKMGDLEAQHGSDARELSFMQVKVQQQNEYIAHLSHSNKAAKQVAAGLGSGKNKSHRTQVQPTSWQPMYKDGQQQQHKHQQEKDQEHHQGREQDHDLSPSATTSIGGGTGADRGSNDHSIHPLDIYSRPPVRNSDDRSNVNNSLALANAENAREGIIAASAATVPHSYDKLPSTSSAPPQLSSPQFSLDIGMAQDQDQDQDQDRSHTAAAESFSSLAAAMVAGRQQEHWPRSEADAKLLALRTQMRQYIAQDRAQEEAEEADECWRNDSDAQPRSNRWSPQASQQQPLSVRKSAVVRPSLGGSGESSNNISNSSTGSSYGDVKGGLIKGTPANELIRQNVVRAQYQNYSGSDSSVPVSVPVSAVPASNSDDDNAYSASSSGNMLVTTPRGHPISIDINFDGNDDDANRAGEDHDSVPQQQSQSQSQSQYKPQSQPISPVTCGLIKGTPANELIRQNVVRAQYQNYSSQQQQQQQLWQQEAPSSSASVRSQPESPTPLTTVRNVVYGGSYADFSRGGDYNNATPRAIVSSMKELSLNEKIRQNNLMTHRLPSPSIIHSIVTPRSRPGTPVKSPAVAARQAAAEAAHQQKIRGVDSPRQVGVRARTPRGSSSSSAIAASASPLAQFMRHEAHNNQYNNNSSSRRSSSSRPSSRPSTPSRAGASSSQLQQQQQQQQQQRLRSSTPTSTSILHQQRTSATNSSPAHMLRRANSMGGYNVNATNNSGAVTSNDMESMYEYEIESADVFKVKVPVPVQAQLEVEQEHTRMLSDLIGGHIDPNELIRRNNAKYRAANYM